MSRAGGRRPEVDVQPHDTDGNTVDSRMETMFTEDMTTCTGTSYHVNPDAPEEGTDIHHDESCPTHGPLSPVQVAIRKRQMAHRLGYRDGYYGKPSRGYIVCGGDFDLIAIYNDAKDRGFSDHRNGVAFGD